MSLPVTQSAASAPGIHQAATDMQDLLAQRYLWTRWRSRIKRVVNVELRTAIPVHSGLQSPPHSTCPGRQPLPRTRRRDLRAQDLC